MKLNHLTAIVLGAISLSAVTLPSIAATTSQVALTPAVAKEIATDAYKYGIMQSIFYGQRYAYTQDTGGELYTGVNRWHLVNDGQPISADNKAVVTPNGTVAYGFSYLDLQNEPVVVEMPEVKDRYFSVHLMDQYGIFYLFAGNQFNGTSAQKYLIVGDGYEGELPPEFETTQIIHAPTNTSAGLIRYARHDAEDKNDNKIINNYLDASTITPLSQWIANGREGISRDKKEMVPGQYKTFPRMGDLVERQVDLQTAEDFYNYMTLVLNDPSMSVMKDSAKEKEMLKELEKIGLAKGKDFDLNDFSAEIKKALVDGFETGRKEVRTSTPQMLVPMQDWFVVLNSGDFDTNWEARAWMADFGYLGPDKNSSHGAAMLFKSSDGKLLTGERDYTITFEVDDLPPVGEFWSIPLYDQNGYFIKNDINRYTINSFMLDDLHQKDGKITIYIQNEKPKSADMQKNWLPSPEGEFRLTPRFYSPKQAIIDGSYKMPSVKPTAK